MSEIVRSSSSLTATSSTRFIQTIPVAPKPPLNPLHPLRQWLDNFQIKNPRLARFLYKAIPGDCPFERDIILFGRKLAHIPPLCKLNPLYEQLVALRFRCMCYLVDECGEAI
jgi:hypothetical protein